MVPAETSSTTPLSPHFPAEAHARMGYAVELLSYVLMAGGMATIVAAAVTAVAAYFRAPFWDMWEIPRYLASRPVPLATWLWLQHNEHRIPLPKLLILADYRWFNGAEIFLRTTIFLIMLATLALLLWAFHHLGGLRATVWRTCAGLAGLCLFCTAQWENLASGFQIAFILVGLLLSAVFVSLLLHVQACDEARRYSRVSLSIAIFAAVALTYTIASGIVVWPILLLVAARQRVPKRTLALIATVALLTIASYLYHYQSPVYHANPFVSLRQPWRIATYMATYLGAPWVLGSFKYPVLFGWIGITSAVLVVATTLFSSPRPSIVTLMAALLLFSLCTAGMTALGRVNFGAEQALSSRYETFSLLFWLCLGVLLIRFASAQSTAFFVAIQLLILALMLIGVYRVRYPIRAVRERAVLANTASLALLAGVQDSQLLATLYPDPETVIKSAQYLRKNRLSVFSTDLAKHLNQPLSATYELRDAQCDGALDTVQAAGFARGGLKLDGWAWDPLARRPVSQIVFGLEGTIVGYGEVGYARRDVTTYLHSRKALYSGWVGVVEPLRPSSPIHVYGVVTGHPAQVCRISNLSIPSAAGLTQH